MKRVTVEFSIQGSVTSEKETEVAAVLELIDILKKAGLDTSQIVTKTTVKELLPPSTEEYLGTVSTEDDESIHVFTSTRQYAECVVYLHNTEPVYWELEELRGNGGWHESAAALLDAYLKRAKKE